MFKIYNNLSFVCLKAFQRILFRLKRLHVVSWNFILFLRVYLFKRKKVLNTHTNYASLLYFFSPSNLLP